MGNTSGKYNFSGLPTGEDVEPEDTPCSFAGHKSQVSQTHIDKTPNGFPPKASTLCEGPDDNVLHEQTNEVVNDHGSSECSFTTSEQHLPDHDNNRASELLETVVQSDDIKGDNSSITSYPAPGRLDLQDDTDFNNRNDKVPEPWTSPESTNSTGCFTNSKAVYADNALKPGDGDDNETPWFPEVSVDLNNINSSEIPTTVSVKGASTEDTIHDRNSHCSSTARKELDTLTANDDNMGSFTGQGMSALSEVVNRIGLKSSPITITTVDSSETEHALSKADQIVMALTCQICIPYLVEHLDDVDAYCDQLLRIGHGIEPPQVNEIINAGTRDAQVKRLLFHLIENQKLHRLFEICDSDSIRQGFIKEKLLTISEDVREGWIPDNDLTPPGFRDVQIRLAGAILIRDDPPGYLHQLEKYFLSNLQVTMSLLKQLVKYGIMHSSDKYTIQEKDPDVWATTLVEVLASKGDGAMFAFLSVLANELPSTWKKLDDFIISGTSGSQENSQHQGNIEGPCVSMKTEMLAKKTDEVYRMELIGIHAYKDMEELLDRYEARIRKVMQGCVIFIIQFKTIKGLLQCWLDYINGVLVVKISEIMAFVSDLSPGDPEDLDDEFGMRIHIENQSFLDALNVLITEMGSSVVSVKSIPPCDSAVNDPHYQGKFIRDKTILTEQIGKLKEELAEVEKPLNRTVHQILRERDSDGYFSLQGSPRHSVSATEEDC